MLDIVYDNIGQDIFEAWIYLNHPDTPVVKYYDGCEMANQLTNEVLKPFRKEFIETVIQLDMDDSEAQQIQYLYTTHNNLNDPDSIEALVIRMYLILMEDFDVPFHALITIANSSGAILFNAGDIYND